MLNAALECIETVIDDDEEVMFEAICGYKSGTNSGLRRSTILFAERVRDQLRIELEKDELLAAFKGSYRMKNGNLMIPPFA